MTKLFVGGIPYSITKQQLEELFVTFGQVTAVNIVIDKITGQSKGFAFVEMENDSEAEKAIQELNGYDLEGRKIGVSVARPREDRPDQGNSRFNKKPGFSSNRSGFAGNNYQRRDNRFSDNKHRR